MLVPHAHQLAARELTSITAVYCATNILEGLTPFLLLQCVVLARVRSTIFNLTTMQVLSLFMSSRSTIQRYAE